MGGQPWKGEKQMTELWKDVPNYEGLYEVSNLGEVKSLARYHHRRERLLKPKIDKYGYPVVALYKNSMPKFITIHRLVMLTFVGKSKLTVNHIDKNRLNNHLSNLEYMTTKENVRHSLAQPLVATSLDGKTKLYFKSMKEVKEKGFNYANVWKHVNGIKGKQTKGFIFKKVEKGGDANAS